MPVEKKSKKKINAVVKDKPSVCGLRSKAGRGRGRAGISLSSGRVMKERVLFEWDGDSQMEHCVQFWVPHFLSNASADDVDFFLFVA